MAKLKLTSLLVVLCAPVWLAAATAVPTLGYEPAFTRLQFDKPVLLTHAGDDSGRLFVVEQSGTIRVFEASPDVRRSEVFFDINKATDNRFLSGGEQGLLGLAFDPDYRDNGWFYINYTASNPRRTVIARYRVSSNNPNRTDYTSEQILLSVEQDYSNHNGGMVAFGADGKLYIGMGDGGSGGDPKHRAQDGQSLLGKMLRIEPNGDIPSDNPFMSNSAIRDEIWALGLRNPWRFSFDAQTGALWLADVGQNAVEEINVVNRGGNYGWRYYEGSAPFNPDAGAQGKTFEAPVFEYTHREGQSVTGGVVYRGQQYPVLQGWYVFGDFVSGAMWTLSTDDYQAVRQDRIDNPAGFGTDAAGELYVVSYTGRLYQVTAK